MVFSVRHLDSRQQSCCPCNRACIGAKWRVTMTKHGLLSATATAVVAFLSGISALGLPSAVASESDAMTVWGSYQLAAEPTQNSRTVIEWDSQHHPLKVTNIPPWGTTVDSTICAYYPGTKHVRMKARVDFH